MSFFQEGICRQLNLENIQTLTLSYSAYPRQVVGYIDFEFSIHLVNLLVLRIKICKDELKYIICQ